MATRAMVEKGSRGTAVFTLPTDTQIQITRVFDAPKHLVYRAWTTPQLIKRWWSGNRGEVTVADVDLRVGGTWRFVIVTDSGFEVGFHGEYRELITNDRIVYTEVFEGAPGGDSAGVLNTMTLTEKDGRTTLTLLTEAGNREIRDLIMNSGMESGVQDGWDLLEQLVISLM